MVRRWPRIRCKAGLSSPPPQGSWRSLAAQKVPLLRSRADLQNKSVLSLSITNLLSASCWLGHNDNRMKSSGLTRYLRRRSLHVQGRHANDCAHRKPGKGEGNTIHSSEQPSEVISATRTSIDFRKTGYLPKPSTNMDAGHSSPKGFPYTSQDFEISVREGAVLLDNVETALGISPFLELLQARR